MFQNQLWLAMSLFSLAQLLHGAGDSALPCWDFNGPDAQRWVAQAHHCQGVRVEDGVLKGVTAGRDPFLTSPSFAVKATAGQAVEFRAKVAAGGRGELFWIPQGEKQALQKWSAAFDWIGDGRWHDYRVRPFWQGERAIGALRLDFVNAPAAAMPFEISSMRIVDESGALHTGEPHWQGAALAAWTASDGAAAAVSGGLLEFSAPDGGSGTLESPRLKVDAGAAGVVAIEMKVGTAGKGTLRWASDGVSGMSVKKFPLRADGRFHVYNIDLSGETAWRETIVMLQLAPAGGGASIRSIRICDEPQGPADISLAWARISDALSRAGRALPLTCLLENSGGRDARNLTLTVNSLPDGVTVEESAGWNRIATLRAGARLMHTFNLRAAEAVSGTVELELSGDGADGLSVAVPIVALPELKLAKSRYVPPPRPVKSDYEIGAFYFPGWSKIEAWERIWPTAPERKPVLGWYDESSPEVVDWQIKWAVENGISFFLLDWYWNRGHQHHDHWVKAFQQARYRSYLKFALMWANHNAPGSHSVEDQRQVVRFWIENYFSMPEYYRIDDKPAVMIWSPQNMERDAGAPGGCRRLLELSREMARAAGYKGIYFIAMKWPEASTDPAVVQGLKEMGFDMTSIYHFMDHGGRAQNPRRFSFDLVAEANAPFWRARHQTALLPFLPNLSTGWDSSPWHGDGQTVIYGRTVEHFRRICRDAKEFADETGVKRLVLAPVNEWGEGSYAEPCAEFGFGMYEAVRDTFCRKPEDGWPLNFAPADVGLGPYDLPLPESDTATRWEFSAGMQGWSRLMGIGASVAGGTGLSFVTTTRDPAIQRRVSSVRARDFSEVVVRMKAPAGTEDSCQLFWSSGGTPTESSSLTLPLARDGAFQDYRFRVGASRAWRGRIGYLRLDPCNAPGVQMEIDSICLIPVEE
jgi:hypothetical protein